MLKLLTRDPPTVSVSLLSPVLAYLASKGIGSSALFESAGLDPSMMKDPDARVPHEVYNRLEDEAARLSGDPEFGLHVGEFFEPGAWSLLGFMMMHCRTLGEAFEKSAKYSKIIGTVLHARGVLRGNTAKIILETRAGCPHLSRHCAETVFSSSVRMMRSLAGTSIDPIEVRFTSPAPFETSEYERIFRCPVWFGQAENSLSMDARIGTLPVLRASTAMLDHFERFADEYLSDHGALDSTSKAVTRLVLAKLDDGTLSVAKVAQEMGMSARTLQTRLEEEGAGFSEIRQTARVRLAKRFLNERKSVEDITYLLGFSEASVFRRAFKKWTGMTPVEYREMNPANGENAI